MNVHESDQLRAMLNTRGYSEVGRNEDAEVIIFNTCCIRNTAEQKIISHIGEVGKIKQKCPDIFIAIIGCLSAKNADILKKKFSFVNLILGTNQLSVLVENLTGKVSVIPGVGNNIIITHGCENFCAYCIVPFVRGKEFSRAVSEIESEFHQIKRCGKTIFLLGQNVNSYICPHTGINFVGLLDHLCALTKQEISQCTINFLSSHPKDFSSALIDCIVRNPQVERNIHLPLQSGCNKILHLMNRGYTVEQYTEKVNALRERIPDIHITTDIICGFPGETENDFSETIEAMKRLQFDAAFIFPYSIRTDTAAAKMADQLDTETKKRRTTQLIAIQREISRAKVLQGKAIKR